MNEFLMAIAMLCQIHPTHDYITMDDIEKHQLQCQQYYLKCAGELGLNLEKCVLERKL